MTTHQPSAARPLTNRQRKAQYKEFFRQAAYAAAERVAKEADRERRIQRSRIHGNTVRDISRDASRRGVIHNTPVKVNTGGYVVSSAP